MEKVTVEAEVQIDYGHTLPNHYSFCNQIHGHRGRIVATVVGPVCTDKNSSSQGMVYDFKNFKELLKTNIHDVLDHGFAIWKDDVEPVFQTDVFPDIKITTRSFIEKRNTKVLVTDEPPTAEYLAKWAYHQILKDLPEELTLVSVKWYETPTNCATYTKN